MTFDVFIHARVVPAESIRALPETGVSQHSVSGIVQSIVSEMQPRDARDPVPAVNNVVMIASHRSVHPTHPELMPDVEFTFGVERSRLRPAMASLVDTMAPASCLPGPSLGLLSAQESGEVNEAVEEWFEDLAFDTRADGLGAPLTGAMPENMRIIEQYDSPLPGVNFCLLEDEQRDDRIAEAIWAQRPFGASRFTEDESTWSGSESLDGSDETASRSA